MIFPVICRQRSEVLASKLIPPATTNFKRLKLRSLKPFSSIKRSNSELTPVNTEKGRRLRILTKALKSLGLAINTLFIPKEGSIRLLTVQQKI